MVGAALQDADATALAASRASALSTREASIGGAIRLGAEIVIRLSSVIATLWLTRSLGVTSF